MPKPWNRFRAPRPNDVHDEDIPRERSITVFVYDAKTLTEHTLQDVAELRAIPREGKVTWVSVEGMPDEHQLAVFADVFQMHPGIVAQLVKPFPGGRIEEYGDQRLVRTRMFRLVGQRCIDEDTQIIFNSSFVLSIQEGLMGDCLDAVRNRLRHQGGHIREEAAEHLAIGLVDAIVDSYFKLLEQLGTALDTLEDDILLRHDRSAPARIHSVKREITKLRHAVWPLRDSLNAYYRDADDSLSKHTQVFLRDCVENAVRVMEMLDTNRELCSDLMDLHLSTASARMNEVMKVLTIITTLFIPPTFVAGIYGMNFATDKSPWNMPELNWALGYPFALTLMFSMVAMLVWFLHRRGCFTREVISYRKRDAEDS
jgi:magnesium transporter